MIAIGTLITCFLYTTHDNKYVGIYGTIGITIILALATAYKVKIRRTVYIKYDLNENIKRAFASFCRSFDDLAESSRIWNVNTARGERDWKRNAGAEVSVDRSLVKLSYRTPAVIKTNINIPSITGGNQSIYFFPDVVLVIQAREGGAITYRQLHISWGVSAFIEEGSVPRDSIIVRIYLEVCQ